MADNDAPFGALPDDEAVDLDIASVVEDWFEREAEFTADEIVEAYVRGYRTGANL